MILHWLKSQILQLIGRRLLTAVPVLIGVSLLSFFIVSFLPGNTASQLIGAEATADQVARLEEQLNLHLPAGERYFLWLKSTLAGNLGSSLTSGQPVAKLLAERLPVTLELCLYAFFLSLFIAVPLALLSARRPFGLWDRFTGVLSIFSLSIANYVLAVVLILVFAVQLRLFPAIGFTAFKDSMVGNIHSLSLPALAIAIPLFGFYARFLRGDLLEQYQGKEYIVAAAAKGLGPWYILLRHALRNSSLGLLTVVGLNLGTLLGATVIVEQIFALPGIGQLLLQSINLRDVVVVQAIVLLLAVVTVLANLVVDILYGVLDPRIRYG